MRIAVLKCGGSIINELTSSFFQSLRELQNDGYKLVFVHGGGPDINEMLNKMEIPISFQNGLRITTKETLAVAEMVLSGVTNRGLVSKLMNNGFPAIGLNGSDQLLKANEIDKDTLGFVGEINGVNTKLLNNLLKDGYIPVITPIALSSKGEKLNVNADSVAGVVAKELQGDVTIFLTDVTGVKSNDQYISELSMMDAYKLIEEKVIYGGMIPKVEAALKSLETGINRVLIASGHTSFYKEKQFIGTMLQLEEVKL